MGGRREGWGDGSAVIVSLWCEVGSFLGRKRPGLARGEGTLSKSRIMHPQVHRAWEPLFLRSPSPSLNLGFPFHTDMASSPAGLDLPPAGSKVSMP